MGLNELEALLLRYYSAAEIDTYNRTPRPVLQHHAFACAQTIFRRRGEKRAQRELMELNIQYTIAKETPDDHSTRHLLRRILELLGTDQDRELFKRELQTTLEGMHIVARLGTHDWTKDVVVRRERHPQNPNEGIAFVLDVTMSKDAQRVLGSKLRFDLPITQAWRFFAADEQDPKDPWLVAAGSQAATQQPHDGMLINGHWRAYLLANLGAKNQPFAMPDELAEQVRHNLVTVLIRSTS